MRNTIFKSAVHDGPGLLSAAGGTALYIGHLPDLAKKPREKNSMYNGNPFMKFKTPAEELLPNSNISPMATIPHYFTFSITATSPLTAPQ